MPAIRFDMDETAHQLLCRVKEAIVTRNGERAKAGDFDVRELASNKAILQRGIASLAKEVLTTADAI